MRAPAFDITSQEFKRNPFPQFARMRDAGPFARVKLPMVGEIYAATTYESVTALLRDQATFVLEPRNAGRKGMPGVFRWMPRSLRLLTRNMLTTDEPDHRLLRGLVEQAFLRQSVDAMRGRLATLAEGYLQQLARHGRSEPVDLIEHFARPFPLAVICELLGLPEEDRPVFSQFAGRLTRATSVLTTLSALPGIWRLLQYLRRQFAECRRGPRPGLISALVEAEQDGNRLSEDELLAMSFLLLLAGHETTIHLISGAVGAPRRLWMKCCAMCHPYR
jgi:cytochrome P450